jgi:hypothetical protein
MVVEAADGEAITQHPDYSDKAVDKRIDDGRWSKDYKCQSLCETGPWSSCASSVAGEPVDQSAAVGFVALASHDHSTDAGVQLDDEGVRSLNSFGFGSAYSVRISLRMSS